MVQNIVIGYDGSESADRALERAAELAGDGATITVVSAVHAPGSTSGEEGPLDHEQHRLHLAAATARLADLGVTARAVEGVGDPAAAIAREAKEVGADLIVVGDEHKHVLERLIVGSVSSGVAHRVGCDVLVVR